MARSSEKQKLSVVPAENPAEDGEKRGLNPEPSLGDSPRPATRAEVEAILGRLRAAEENSNLLGRLRAAEEKYLTTAQQQIHNLSDEIGLASDLAKTEAARLAASEARLAARLTASEARLAEAEALARSASTWGKVATGGVIATVVIIAGVAIYRAATPVPL